MKRFSLLLFAALALTFTTSGGLVGHWTFDEGSGTNILDSSGLGNHGLLVNPKPFTWTNGHSGGGLYLDGTAGSGSTYVAIPDAVSLHLTNAISFAAWVRCDDLSRGAPILDKEAPGKLSYWFGTLGSGNFGVLLSGDGNAWAIQDLGPGNISQGQWMHLASTWDGAVIRHYVNGALLPSARAFSGPIHVSDAGLVIGANFPFNSTAFKGIIDDARLYDHALSLAEVQALVGAKRQLVGHWTFEEARGTNILDHSGEGNHGTLIHPKTNTWTQGVSGSALYFDGTVGANSTYVAVPDSASLHISTEISFAAWVRCDDIFRNAPIVDKEGEGKLAYWFGTEGRTTPGNFGMLLDADGNQNWSIYDWDQGAVPQGQWVHLASTWDGAVIRHYVNGQPLSQTGSFPAPTHISDAFLAIGVNSLYNYTAFKGAIDEVRLYNYGLSPEEVRALYLAALFHISAVTREGNDLRLAWECLPGRSYVVQTNGFAGLASAFADLTPPIAVPADFAGTGTNYVHAGASSASGALFYRVKLLP